MTSPTPVADEIGKAIAAVRYFIAETTGTEPTDGEIARALHRYFVLAEIKEHIEMERGS